MKAAEAAMKERLSRLQQTAAVDVDSIKERAAAMAETARQTASAVDVATIKERAAAMAETARSHAENAKARLQKASQQASSTPDAGESSDDTITEDERGRLVKGDADAARDRIRCGMDQFGARLGQFGMASKSGLCKSVDGARAMSARGADGLRCAMAAGSTSVESLKHASANRVEKLRSATADAKGRCGEALSAAAAVSGVRVPGQETESPMQLCPCCPALTYKQRLVGAFICLGLGTLLSLGSLTSIAKLLLGNPLPFALKYTFGNILSLGASSFLVGPARQCRGMFARERRVASLVYICTLCATLVSVFVLRLGLLSLVFVILQSMALTWYMLSYVPYGRTAAKRLCQRLLRKAGFGKAMLPEPSAPLSSSAEP